MKKTIILTAYFSTFLTYTMEKENHNKNDLFSIVLYGTTINVSRTSLSDIANNVNLLIVGKHEQQLLTNTAFDKFYNPGTVDFPETIFCKHIDDESASDDETYKPFQEENRSKLWEKVIEKNTSAKIISVIEPRISSCGWGNNYETNTQTPISCYTSQIFNNNNPYLELWNLYGDHAISEASKDLILCYEEVLTLCLPTDTTAKSIAIPTLSADVGFPREKAAPLALTVITDFLRHNPNIPNNNAYDRIELLVKKRSDFAAYTTFLMNYWKKPGVLILAHKDPKHFLYEIPQDIIDYILQLMYPCAQ